MHEMSLCESLVAAIEESARSDGFRRVYAVRLAVGRFAGVEVEALRFCFDVVARGSVADGAALTIVEEPGTAWCFGCGDTVPLAGRLDPCPVCGGERLVPNGGTDMRIKDLEVA